MVPGAGQEMGKAIAEKLAPEGSRVAVCDLNEQAAQAGVVMLTKELALALAPDIVD